jgi:TRAP-type C4-dicarboxylate transport system permease small subunit
MNKVKGLLLLLLGALLVAFGYQNWQPPSPPIQLFGYDLPAVPQALIIYNCLVLGFLGGWMTHVLRLRKKRAAQAQALAQQEAGESDRPEHQ